MLRPKRYKKECLKVLSTKEQTEIEDFERNTLPSTPYVGDQLVYPFFREKKIDGKRILYLIYDEFRAVLMVAVVNKKMQQSTIDFIKQHLPLYREYAKEEIRQLVLSGRFSHPQDSQESAQ